MRQENNALTKLQEHVGRVSALMNPVTYVIINLATVVLIWVGAVRVDTAIITQGAVVALINYMSQILVELIKLANLIINITKALACASRVQGGAGYRVLHGSPPGPFQCGGAEPGTWLPFETWALTYQGAGAASLSGLSFSVKPGETVGVIGGTGSGQVLPGELDPPVLRRHPGRRAGGRPQRAGLSPGRPARKRWGWCPRRRCCSTGTIRDNLQWGKPGRHRRGAVAGPGDRPGQGLCGGKARRPGRACGPGGTRTSPAASGSG